ncbi:MAG: hypothetical protein JSW46_05875 [Gemmatimonadota bacterium]|nr:MAG: hypothetical protein JSW46_05875 [Gemmatimonadota bacterium]
MARIRPFALALCTIGTTLGAGEVLAQDEAPLERRPIGVPLDITQGAVVSRSDPTPYALSFRVAPQVRFGEGGVFRVGHSAAVTFTNPDWEVAVGARVAVRAVKVVLPEVGLLVVGDAAWGSADRWPLALGVIFDLDGLVRFGPWVTRDAGRGEWYVEGLLGADLVSLVGFFRGERHEEPEFNP